jgi:excisionase family DNA binding protein
VHTLQRAPHSTTETPGDYRITRTTGNARLSSILIGRARLLPRRLPRPHRSWIGEACGGGAVNGETMATATNFEPLLTATEAAALLKIHPKTLQRMARRGRIPARRIGDLWRFRASELDAWLKSEVFSDRHSCRS